MPLVMPVYDSLIIREIQENLSIGTVICRLSNLIIPRPSPNTKFSLMKNNFFTIEEGDKLIVSSKIDRDNNLQLCIRKNTNFSCIWKSYLLSNTGVYRDLEIRIIDENDNFPKWSKNSLLIEVRENSPIDSFRFELPKATDPDEFPNNIKSYKIEPQSKYFDLISMESISGIKPILKLKRDIDRELISWHNITILAVDGGTTPNTGSLFLYIKILDENDNSPIFESSVYTKFIDSNLNFNSVLDLKIRASDLDIDANGLVTYRISVDVPFIVQNCFELDRFNAIIKIKKSFNRDCYASEYRFSITASDNGQPMKSSKTSVILYFKNQNLNPPKIILPNNNHNINVPENNEIGVMILSGAVKDKDSEKNGEFFCYLQNQNNRDILIKTNKTKIEDVTLISLIANTQFDREKISRFRVTIVCEDLGKPALTSSVDILIRILDLNDNSPKFDKEFYHKKIYEENQPNYTIAQLIAHDNDADSNARLKYQIEWGKAEYDAREFIKIDTDGRIIAKHSLDREKFPNGFKFQVVATDCGTPQKSGSTLVYIELLDINDHIPVFEHPFYNLTFIEDFGSKKILRNVTFFRAHDEDLGRNGEVTYSIVSDNPLPFKLHNSTGELYSYDLVDRETQPSHYTFSVLAKDNPTNLLYRKTATVSVSIAIEDFNDNKPVFIFPNESDYKIQLSYFVPVGTVVTIVKATDKDFGMNSQILYSLEEAKRNILFSINETSGELITSTVLSVIHKGEENLFIRAMDCGTPQLSSIQRLTIEIGEFKNSDSTPYVDNEESFLSDQATFIIVGIILGTFFICCGLVTGICTMAYRRWHSSNNRTAGSQLYQVGEELTNLQYIDNYLIMKELT